MTETDDINTHRISALADAIVKIAEATGMVDNPGPMTGPEVLMLAEDTAEYVRELVTTGSITRVTSPVVILEAIRTGQQEFAKYATARSDAHPGAHTVGLPSYENWQAQWPHRQTAEFISKAVAKALANTPKVVTSVTALGTEVTTFEQFHLRDASGTVLGTYNTLEDAKRDFRDGLEIVSQEVTYHRLVGHGHLVHGGTPYADR
ncbi:hypothetical protein [Aeromicrobium sp. 179-A 4D2 NHS]|uniref:hypothetical protein n=1 Tax=Aeromicrobium sp. 179-A 4D2 NHS TaxID=3142375 RepID=UPI0039A23475